MARKATKKRVVKKPKKIIEIPEPESTRFTESEERQEEPQEEIEPTTTKVEKIVIKEPVDVEITGDVKQIKPPSVYLIIAFTFITAFGALLVTITRHVWEELVLFVFPLVVLSAIIAIALSYGLYRNQKVGAVILIILNLLFVIAAALDVYITFF